jgi:hypothetical protein
MPVATRLLVAFVLLICAFVVLVGVAVYSLYTVGQPTMAAVVATAGLAGVAAGGVTYWILRREAGEEVEIAFGDLLDARAPAPVQPAMPAASPMPTAPRTLSPRRPLRVQAMPVANLPPAYVDAVMRGAQARLSALKGQTRQQ